MLRRLFLPVMPRFAARRLRLGLAQVALIVAILPQVALASHEGSVYGTGGDGVWLKAAPSLTAARIMVLPEGTPLTLLQGPIRTENDYWWARVEVDGTVGWMVAEYLLMDDSPPPIAMTAAPPAAPAPAAGATFAPGSWAMVVDTAPAEGLRVRTGPSPAETLLTILPEGSSAQVLEGPRAGSNGDPWYRLSANGKTGWADGIYLAPAAAPVAGPSGLAAGAWAQVTGTAQWGGLRLRTGPSPGDALITSLPDGTKLRLVEGPVRGGNGDPWYRVAWKDSWGWVDGLYLVPAAAAPVPAPVASTAAGRALVQVAMGQLGKPYVWGATGPNGFDCSGLTLFAARQALGVTLPRTADAQAWSGVHVAPDQLAPGDLVFYANTYQPGISHVGIYIGNNQWVNAQDEDTGVVVLSLDEPYWKTRYAGARRIT